MTATEELRAMLDEQGLEWREHEAPATDCIAFFDGNGWHDCWESVGGEVNVTFSMTPEQAIEATLGREPDDAEMVKLHDQMNAALLEYERVQGIEKRDGDGEIVVPFVFKMHSLLEEAATLGRGECHDTEESRWFHCSECGFGMFDLYTDGDWYDEEQPKFCPNCGRRVVGRRYLKVDG